MKEKKLVERYQFRPHTHWNYIPHPVYEVLCKFYTDRLRVIYEEEDA